MAEDRETRDKVREISYIRELINRLSTASAVGAVQIKHDARILMSMYGLSDVDIGVDIDNAYTNRITSLAPLDPESDKEKKLLEQLVAKYDAEHKTILDEILKNKEKLSKADEFYDSLERIEREIAENKHDVAKLQQLIATGKAHADTYEKHAELLGKRIELINDEVKDREKILKRPLTQKEKEPLEKVKNEIEKEKSRVQTKIEKLKILTQKDTEISKEESKNNKNTVIEDKGSKKVEKAKEISDQARKDAVIAAKGVIGSGIKVEENFDMSDYLNAASSPKSQSTHANAVAAQRQSQNGKGNSPVR